MFTLKTMYKKINIKIEVISDEVRSPSMASILNKSVYFDVTV